MSEFETSASHTAETTPASTTEQTARPGRPATTASQHLEGAGTPRSEDRSAMEYCVENDLI